MPEATLLSLVLDALTEEGFTIAYSSQNVISLEEKIDIYYFDTDDSFEVLFPRESSLESPILYSITNDQIIQNTEDPIDLYEDSKYSRAKQVAQTILKVLRTSTPSPDLL